MAAWVQEEVKHLRKKSTHSNNSSTRKSTRQLLETITLYLQPLVAIVSKQSTGAQKRAKDETTAMVGVMSMAGDRTIMDP